MNLGKIAIGAFLSLCVAGLPAFGATSVVETQNTVTTLPITFTKTIRSDRAHIGDAVEASVSQSVLLANGTTIRSGARVLGHIVESSASKGEGSSLSFTLDSIQLAGEVIPIHVQLRAIADYFETQGTWLTPPSDVDPTGTQTLVGGDQFVPWYREIVNSNGAIVGHNRKGAVYSRLAESGDCNASSNEVPMGRFSADACGLYGFNESSLANIRYSTVSIISHADKVLISRYSSALLVLSSIGNKTL